MTDILINIVTTKQGDEGCTLAYLGAKQPKYHNQIVLLGDLDELNASIGVAAYRACTCKGTDEELFARYVMLDEVIDFIQQKLFDIGAQLYTGDNRLTISDISLLETNITKFTNTLPPLTSFIIAKGRAASWHLARTICRRAERSLWAMYFQNNVTAEHQDGYKNIGVFLNRLSDLLFCISRLYDNEEILWNRHKI